MAERVMLVRAEDALGSLKREFSALHFQLLTPELESATSHGLTYRRLWSHCYSRRYLWLTGFRLYQWLLPDQVRFKAQANNPIWSCASFTDLWFFVQFPEYIPKHWYGRRIYGWKTCFRFGNLPRMALPYLDCTERSTPPRIRYICLDENSFYTEIDFAAIRT